MPGYTRNLLLIALLVCTAQHLYAQKKPIDVYLIGGQPNATGQGYMVNLPPDFVVDTTVLIFHSHLLKGKTPYTWQPLYQASETPDKFGVELSFGSRLQAHFPERRIALIKHAYSGSNLYEDWKPGKNKRDSANFGQQFGYFIRTVEAGLDQLRSQGFSPEIKAMLWQQGEGDARDIAGPAPAQNYGRNLHKFIRR
ncbi:MAG: sialate O-acetylesterase, partial [Bacteroidetes bacterium]|nr:sialate O-acetylesterase [Bacteroidota bacterium]